MNTKENIIVKLSFEFALEIIKFAEQLQENKQYVIANQLLKSGTSIGANIRESQEAESKTDFIHKLKIASKEVSETEYWLLLCKHSEKYPNTDNLIDMIQRMKKILGKIIFTSKQSNK